MQQRTCNIDGCDKAAQKQRTVCRMRRARMHHHGTHDDPTPSPLARFHGSVVRDGNGCWLWTGALNDHGYGQFTVGRVRHYAHRWSYQTFVGVIPDGLQIDHLCRVRSCVNPEHLEPVTALVNNRRGESPWSVNARKTHCIRGHEFTSANTTLSRQGWRSCRECQRIRNASRKTATAA